MMQLFRQYPHWLICLLSVISVTGYWSFWASDRYVSESNVVLESPQIGPSTLNFSALLSGVGASAGAGRGDMLLLRDYLLSVDMLRKVDNALSFRKHYASRDADFFSRLKDVQAPIEDLHEYYLNRVSVELDDYAQVLRIKIQAFSPSMANSMTNLLLTEGEAHMNAMGQRLAEEQVRFLEKQVNKLNDRFTAARQNLLDYQNENGLISPMGTIENLNAVVANLEAKLTELKAKRSILTSYQSAYSPEVVRINSEINALNQQTKIERARLTKQSGNALNLLSSEYQTLELKALFAQESYSGALAALENTRIEAARKLKQVSILQSPTFPEYPIEPDRLYNSVAFAVIALLLGLIGQMLILIINDHRD